MKTQAPTIAIEPLMEVESMSNLVGDQACLEESNICQLERPSSEVKRLFRQWAKSVDIERTVTTKKELKEETIVKIKGVIYILFTIYTLRRAKARPQNMDGKHGSE